MIGPQNTKVKTTLGQLLNGFVNYEYWAPVPKMMFPGVEQLLNTTKPEPATPASTSWDITWRRLPMPRCKWWLRQSKRPVDSTTQASRRTHEAGPFTPVMGAIRFGVNGDGPEPRVLQIQFQGISGHDVGQLRNGSRQIVVSPSTSALESFIYPYAVVA